MADSKYRVIRFGFDGGGSTVTKVSQLENDLNFQTDVQVQELIDTALETFGYVVVDVLPDVGEPHTIYLLKKESGGEEIYEEYVYSEGAWRKIGAAEIDLSEYAKKTDLPTKVSQLENDKNFITDLDIDDYITSGELVDSSSAKGIAETVVDENVNPIDSSVIDDILK